jgi:hypothetical protein
MDNPTIDSFPGKPVLYDSEGQPELTDKELVQLTHSSRQHIHEKNQRQFITVE